MATPDRTEPSIRRTRVHEEVASRLEHMILEELRPGDKLPPERQLAGMFSVSRTSIRDAIHTLELVGLVAPRQGAGTVVRELRVDAVLNPLASVLISQRKLLGELLEVRRMIEPPLAARAAIHATPEEIAEMEDILRRQEEKVQRGELAIEEDSEFHYAIAMAADNTVILKILDVLMDLLRQTRERSLQAEGRLQKSFAGHCRILEALRRRDAKAAESEMRRHVHEIERIVVRTAIQKVQKDRDTEEHAI
jgi:GntR family transcriptional repressor for pyruvate dehydrogenase complex